MLLICQLLLTNDNKFIYKMFILERLIKEGLARFSCLQDPIWNKQEARYHEVGKIIWPLFKYFLKMFPATHWCWKENTTLTVYTSLMQCNFATVLSIIYFNYFFWKLKLKVWDQSVKETMIRYTMQSEQSIQIWFLYVQTKYKF